MRALDLDGIQTGIWNLHHLLDVLRDHVMEHHHDDRVDALVQIARDISQTICRDIDHAVGQLAEAKTREAES